MEKVLVGQPVLYVPQAADVNGDDPNCRFAATVTYVNGDGSVNLFVVDSNGAALHGRTQIALIDDPDVVAQPGQCETHNHWMDAQPQVSTYTSPGGPEETTV